MASPTTSFHPEHSAYPEYDFDHKPDSDFDLDLPPGLASYTEVDGSDQPEILKDQPSDVEKLGKSAMYFTDSLVTKEMEEYARDNPLNYDAPEDFVPEEGVMMHATPDRGIRLSSQEARDPKRLIEAIESQHFVRETPPFAEQAKDATRTNKFTYFPYDESDGRTETMTEHEGLRGLRQKLAEMIADEDYVDSAEDLKDIYDNLTFMGEKELTEASAGIATLWRSYLQENPKNILCLKTLYLGRGGDGKHISKSGPYIMGRILNNFSDEELAAYKGRIIDEPSKLPRIGADPEHTRIILVDDSSMSGAQIQSMLHDLEKEELAPYLETSVSDGTEARPFYTDVEVNLFVAQPQLLENGYAWRASPDTDAQVPVKAYYKAHPTDHNPFSNTSHTTSIHSSVDYGFDANISDARNLAGVGGRMPPLTQIRRTYTTSPPDVIIEDNGTLRRVAKKS